MTELLGIAFAIALFASTINGATFWQGVGIFVVALIPAYALMQKNAEKRELEESIRNQDSK